MNKAMKSTIRKEKKERKEMRSSTSMMLGMIWRI
jgi:hypothetical protein